MTVEVRGTWEEGVKKKERGRRDIQREKHLLCCRRTQLMYKLTAEEDCVLLTGAVCRR